MELPHSADTLWVVSDSLGDFGRTAEASSVLHAVGDRGSRGGSFVRRLPVEDVGELRSRVLEKLGALNSGRQAVLDRRLFGADGSGVDDPDKQGKQTEAVVGRVRAFWIDTDETGSHFKTWRNVVLESTQATFSDSVASGLVTALPVCRKVLQKGLTQRDGSPSWSGSSLLGERIEELVCRQLQQYTPTGLVRNTSPAAVPLSTWCVQRCDRTQVVCVGMRRSSTTYERDQRHTQLAPALVRGPRLPQLWSMVFVVVQLVTVTRVKDM